MDIAKIGSLQVPNQEVVWHTHQSQGYKDQSRTNKHVYKKALMLPLLSPPVQRTMDTLTSLLWRAQPCAHVA